MVAGINYWFAKLLLQRGCNVLIADIALLPEAKVLLEQYTSQPRAIFHNTDVTSWPDLDSMFDAGVTAFGNIDLVCPGAGIYEPHWSNFWHPPGTSVSKDAVDGGRYSILDINVTHPTRVTQMAISHFLNPPPGIEKVSPANPKRIVHISSVAGHVSGLANPMYIASKHAMHGLVRSLAMLETIGIRVNAVAPGLVKTPLWTDHPEKMKLVNEDKDQFCTPEQIADSMLRLCEKEDMVGGIILEVLPQERIVQEYNDPGPNPEHLSLSNGRKGVEDVFGWLGKAGWGVKGNV
ncbi:NAD(P)-binding protein [Eremomyces bilateralis CBS 781.70]|uniref:NAD(P)-binding protein n=1 Tax=Eremomyces bilateralis CBS 781.70 TaxID=1392243 RepID=A0A6G1GF55_9PEZI|nr:NAD(P)-binding protein [Eremomyces bilateralis CBS 781.70]KAF1816745.1 NAD(P)-binding protein [Eremomyces bilateralis CBS 781.70]